MDATLTLPRGIAVDLAGNVFIADTGNNRIRKVAADTQIITTITGTGASGFSGDDGPAIEAAVNQPWGVGTDPLVTCCR